jgi:hypothetical protein
MNPAEKAAIAAKGAEAAALLPPITEEQVDALVRLFARRPLAPTRTIRSPLVTSMAAERDFSAPEG